MMVLPVNNSVNNDRSVTNDGGKVKPSMHIHYKSFLWHLITIQILIFCVMY